MAPRTPGEFGATPAQVFAARQELSEQRRERERREEQLVRESGQGGTTPLEMVPELDRCAHSSSSHSWLPRML